VPFVEISLWQYALFTRRELADKIGTSPSTRSSSASNLPSLVVAFQIAEVLCPARGSVSIRENARGARHE